jgi:murein DD-endopeptidase MepM/ murein hydrolase activator NlpD
MAGISPSTNGRARAFVLIALTLAALMAVAFLPALSSGRSLNDKIDAKKRHLNRVKDKEGSLQVNISKMNGKISGLRVEIGSLQRKEQHAQELLVKRERELSVVTDRYNREHERFVRLRKELDKAQLLLSDRLVEIYKSDRPDLVTVMLDSNGFEDLITRTQYLDKVNEGDTSLVNRVKKLKIQSSRKRALLVDLKQRAQIAVDALETQKRQLSNTRTELSSRKQDLSAARSEQNHVLGGVRQDREKLEGDVSALSAQVETQLGSGTQVAGPIKRGSGQFIWPVNGPITSPFCERRSWEACHPGIDIGVGSGTPIRAAGAGTVAMAGPMGGYGNYTCLQHGGGIQTCYAHQSSIGVSVGQHVSQGQVIGLSGCTGLCFGAHLHFEVRVNGAVQNPLSYL